MTAVVFRQPTSSEERENKDWPSTKGRAADVDLISMTASASGIPAASLQANGVEGVF